MIEIEVEVEIQIEIEIEMEIDTTTKQKTVRDKRLHCLLFKVARQEILSRVASKVTSLQAESPGPLALASYG